MREWVRCCAGRAPWWGETTGKMPLDEEMEGWIDRQKDRMDRGKCVLSNCDD